MKKLTCLFLFLLIGLLLSGCLLQYFYITRLTEQKIIADANGLCACDPKLQEVLASQEPKVLNRLISLETGSLAVEAAIKMMLARFYRLDKTPKAQDVIVFKKTDDEGKKLTFVARVVAVEGDTVEVTEDGVLKVNGNAVSETNIFDKTTLPYVGKDAPEYPLTLGKDECFVLGDKRSEATDSRVFGPVTKKEIMGTVITILRRNNI